MLNGLELVGKDIGSIKLAVSGAGAAAIACLDVMVGLGVKREHIFVVDSRGVIHSQREDALIAHRLFGKRRQPGPAGDKRHRDQHFTVNQTSQGFHAVVSLGIRLPSK